MDITCPARRVATAWHSLHRAAGFGDISIETLETEMLGADGARVE